VDDLHKLPGIPPCKVTQSSTNQQYISRSTASATFVSNYIKNMSQSPPSTLISVPQWDPTESLNINQKPDGNFTCSGMKNDLTSPCGWNLRGETASKISSLLDDISMLSPQIAVHSLKALADISLCHNHKRQARGKVVEWIATINNLSPPTQTGPSITTRHNLSPPHRPTLTPQSTPSQPRGSSISSWSSGSRNRLQHVENSSPNPGTIESAVDDEIRQLRDDITRLTARLASLETNGKDYSNVASPRQVSRQPSARMGIRSALFGRNSN
jgi:hypothetical protein